MNIAALVLRHGRTNPDADALIDSVGRLSHRQLRDETLRTAAHLLAVGIGRGDRVGICLKDTVDHLVALLAIACLGAVATPFDWRARAVENERLIVASGVKLTLVEPGSQSIALGRTEALDSAWRAAVAAADPAEEKPNDWNDPFVIAASSGSTGAAKLTAMSHLQYYFAVSGMLEVLDLAGRHRYLNTLPLYYSGGRNSCLAHLLRGDCVILYPSLFRAGEYAEVARQHRATIGVMVPTMIRRLLREHQDGGHLLPNFTALFSTGAPLFAEEKLQAKHRLCANFRERFGTAETLVLTSLRSDQVAERPESVGQPHTLAEVEIADDGGRALPAGQIGRLRCRGPGLASPVPGGGAESSFHEGWFYPGEIGWLDEMGFLFLQGRVSEVIIRSGAKIHPAEVEQVLREHPRVIEAAVVGRVNEDNEGEVFAFVSTDGEPQLGELIAFCRVRLAPHKTPKRIHVVAQLPKNTAGKIDKLALGRMLDELG